MIEEASYDNCREAVNRAFDLFPVRIRDRRVLVKPNVLRSSEAEEGIVTHPAVLRAVIERVESEGPARIVVGDNPGLVSYGANEACFRRTGLLEAAGDYYQNIGNEAEEVALDSELAERVSVSRAVLEADVVISLPKFKTHGLTILTGGIKNSYGILPGAQKARLHRLAGNPARFNDVIVDVFRLRPPDLFILDAVIGMEGNGPASSDLRPIGRILASDNGVALDAVMARMMGLDPAALRFLETARRHGLGDFAPETIDVIGRLEVIPGFKLPHLDAGAGNLSSAIQELLHSRTVLRPEADPDSCTGCGTCVDQCPVSALVMTDDLPVVDKELCITCFCCQEICPEKAITLK